MESNHWYQKQDEAKWARQQFILPGDAIPFFFWCFQKPRSINSSLHQCLTSLDNLFWKHNRLRDLVLAQICSHLVPPLLGALPTIFAGFIFLAENSTFLKITKPSKEQLKEWTQRAGGASFNESYQEAKVSVRLVMNVKAHCEVSFGKISTTFAKVKLCRWCDNQTSMVLTSLSKQRFNFSPGTSILQC